MIHDSETCEAFLRELVESNIQVARDVGMVELIRRQAGPCQEMPTLANR